MTEPFVQFSAPPCTALPNRLSFIFIFSSQVEPELGKQYTFLKMELPTKQVRLARRVKVYGAVHLVTTKLVQWLCGTATAQNRKPKIKI